MGCARLCGVGALVLQTMRNCNTSTKKLYLPRQERLPDGTPLEVDFMTSKQMSQCYRMIEDDMRRGIGFHPKEYSSFADWQTSIENGQYVAISEAATEAIVCGMVISSCRWTRLHGCSEWIAVVNPDWRHRGVGKLMMALSMEFSQALGYGHVLADPYSNNTAMLQLLRRHDFRHVGSLPTGRVTSSGEPIEILIMLKACRGGA